MTLAEVVSKQPAIMNTQNDTMIWQALRESHKGAETLVRINEDAKAAATRAADNASAVRSFTSFGLHLRRNRRQQNRRNL